MNLCTVCKTEAVENANFCHICGSSLKARIDEKSNSLLKPDHNPDRERRIVTILFSDIKGSTSFAENLDPEDVLGIMNRAFRVLIDPVVKYDGKVARLMGDAILAFFGAPVSHEDDADRACRAALEIVSESRNFAAKLKSEKGIEDFSVRVGINTGLVVVGEVGADFNVEYTAMGDAVNVAARMESLANPGTILITEATKRQLQTSFTFDNLGKIKVKGKKEPISVFRLTGVPVKETSENNRRGLSSPLIGRDNELELISSALIRLKARNGGVISIHGDKGAGKSRLLEESKAALNPELNWIEVKAEAYAAKNPYWLIRNSLRDYLGIPQDESDESTIGRIKDRLNSHPNNTDEIYPFLLHLLNLRRLSDLENDESGASRDVLKGQLHHAVKIFLKHEIKDNPSVFVFENLQWSDLPSRELLSDLIPLTQEIPLLIILVYRLDETHQAAWDFHNKYIDIPDSKSVMIRVRAFDLDNTYNLIKNLLKVKDVPANLINRIYDKTRGNPLFIEDVINSLSEKGILKKTGDKLEIGEYDKEFMVSSLLHSALLSRIDSLNKTEKLVLQTASVIGRVFKEKLLLSILPPNISTEGLKNILITLQQKELILRHLSSSPNRKSLFEKEYVFKNPLVHEVVYSTVLLSHREKLHRQIGESMENMYGDHLNEYIIDLGNHFEKGKDHTKSFKYYLMSGDKAKAMFDNEDAFYFYIKALDESKHGDINDNLLFDLHDSLGHLYSLNAQYNKALDHLNESLKYVSKNVYETSRTYRRIGQVYENLGEYDEAHKYFNSSLDIIDPGADESEAAHVYSLIGRLYFREDKLREAEKYSTRALSILRDRDSTDYLCEVYNNLGNIYGRLNQFEKSLEFHQKCLEIRKKLNDIAGLAASYNNLGHLYELKKEFEKAAECYNTSLDLCEKIGSLHGLARIYDNLCKLYTAKGDEEKAMSYNLKTISIIGKISKETSQINSDVWLQSKVW